MDLYALLLITVYLLTFILIKYGLIRSCRLKYSDKPVKTVSIIVAAKNEEKNIKNCIDSLKKLNYELITEIFLVNDNSTDITKEIMVRETEGFPLFRVIDSSKENPGNLKGKANALNTAIGQCTGEIILGTDADCEVESNWAGEIVKYYDEETGMVCGFTHISYDDSMFQKVQALDWIYLQTMASGSSGIKQTLSCIGNNLSFSRKVYSEIGGYQNISFSVTEDLALMQKIHYDRQYDIKYPVNKNALVSTNACSDFSELYNQKRRWFKGGLKINLLGFFLGIQLYPVNLTLITGWLFLSLPVYAAFVIIKFLSDIILINSTMKEFNITSLYKYFIPFQLYFAFYGLLLPLTFLISQRISWKQRKF